jgi:hypothetical protein
LQPANLLLRLQPKARTNHWRETCLRLNKELFSWESVILTHHCRGLVLLTYLPKEKVWGHLVSGVGGFHLAKKALYGCTRQKLKKVKARASEAGTGDIQQPENADVPKKRETLTETLKRPRLDGSTPMKMARPPTRPRDYREPGTYKEVLTNINIAYLQGSLS